MEHATGAQERLDTERVQFRLASIKVALAATAIVLAGLTAYLLATWDRPNRALLTVLIVVAGASVPTILLLPTERIVRGRWREPFFLIWTGALIALIAAGAAADGGPESPLTLLFVLPLIFGALSYPPLSVLVVAVLDLAGFAAVALIEPGGAPESVLIAVSLLCAAMICIWQARNRHRQDARLAATAEALSESEAVSRLRALQQQEVAAFGQRALAVALIEELMQDAVTTVQRVLDVDTAAVLELQEDREAFLTRAGVGFPEGVVGRVVVPGGQASQAGFTLISDRPVIVEDWDRERRFAKPPVLQQMGVRSGATVLIRGRGRPFGVLGVQSLAPRKLGADNVNFLQAMANSLANAIERRNEEEQARHRALHDSLTGLPNRALFEDRLGRALAEQERRGSSVAVLVLDLDHFKLINESLGHQAGDELLQAVAPRLEQALRPGDTVARFGGDEFGILLEDIQDERDAVRVAERVASVLGRPFVLADREHFVTGSIGIAIGGSGHRPQELLRDADAAMDRAKDRGRARYEIFDETMRVKVRQRLRLENELHSAIKRAELRVHYQPVVALSSRRLAGAEALVRWEHPRNGLLGAGEFISVAEEGGLIVPIGRWVLEESLREAARWQAVDPDAAPVTVSVNVSVRQLSDPGFAGVVFRAIDAAGMEPGWLSLEVTEGTLMKEAERVFSTLKELEALGVRLVLDDFGIGYSSLGYLKRLPFNEIKLDRSFVQSLGAGTVDNAIVSAVVSLAQSLDMSVVAEGVETADQVEIAGELGCQGAQGYFFSPGVPAREFRDLVHQRVLTGHGL